MKKLISRNQVYKLFVNSANITHVNLFWTVLICSIIVVVFLIGGYLILSSLTKQKIILINNSSHTVKTAKIKYCDKSVILKDIKPGDESSKRITARCDSSFDIEVFFSDDSTYKINQLGYITNNDGSDSYFKITENKQVEFSQEH